MEKCSFPGKNTEEPGELSLSSLHTAHGWEQVIASLSPVFSRSLRVGTVSYAEGVSRRSLLEFTSVFPLLFPACLCISERRENTTRRSHMLDGSLKVIPGYFLLICYLSLFYAKKIVEVVDTHNFC